jgi:Meiotically up-regulated gene 113
MGVLAWAYWAILNAGALIRRIRPVQLDAVERRPIDRAREAKLDAKLAARRAEWELHGRAAAEENLRRSVALAAAEAGAEEKLRRSMALISVPAIPAVVPDEPPPQISFIYLIGHAGSAGPFKIGRTNNVEQRLAQLQTATYEKLLLIESHPVPRAEVLSIESRIHETLAGYRMAGEWFSCDLATAKAAMDSGVPV